MNKSYTISSVLATRLLYKMVCVCIYILPSFIYCGISTWICLWELKIDSRLAQRTIHTDLLFFFFFFLIHNRIWLNFLFKTLYLYQLLCLYSFACLCEAEKCWHLPWIKKTVKTLIWKGLLGLLPGCCRQLKIWILLNYNLWWLRAAAAAREGAPGWSPDRAAALSLCTGSQQLSIL